MSFASDALTTLKLGPLTAREIASRIGLGLSQTQKTMSKLKRRGSVRRLDDNPIGLPAMWALASDPSARRVGPQATIWTPELLERASVLYLEGYTHAEIARSLGGVFSRNAVVGKLHRAGVHSETRVIAQRSVARIRQPRVRAVRPPKPTPKPKAAPMPAVPLCDPVAFLSLAPRHCRWPINVWSFGRGTEALFCGAEHVIGSAYCAGHLAQASAPPKDGRLDRLASIR